MTLPQPGRPLPPTAREPRLVAIAIGVAVGIIVPLVGAGIVRAASESFTADGHAANIVPIVLLAAVAALVGPLMLILVGAISRTRDSLRHLATGCFAAATTWVVVLLVGCGAMAAYAWMLSSATEPYPY